MCAALADLTDRPGHVCFAPIDCRDCADLLRQRELHRIEIDAASARILTLL